jgi:hypothetical protein
LERQTNDAHLTSQPLNDFEAEVFDCLSSAGLKLIPQMGASQYRIDMVVERWSIPQSRGVMFWQSSLTELLTTPAAPRGIEIGSGNSSW